MKLYSNVVLRMILHGEIIWEFNKVCHYSYQNRLKISNADVLFEVGGCSVHRRDTMSTSGDIMSTSGDVQYIGGIS